MLTLLALTACGPDAPEPFEHPAIEATPPLAGAAEATLDLPVGAPLGGYSSRCNYLGSDSKVDNRAGAYTHAFMRSAGVQTRAALKALWLEAGGEDLVLIKSDAIYSFDGLVEEVARQLSEATGRDLHGRVVMSASHTHHAPANFSDQIHFYLGGDRYNEEIFQRYAATAVAVSLDAFARLEPAALGSGWARDWDPDDRVYRDRRGDNDQLAVWDDAAPGAGKDPHLHLLRVDDLDGEPIAAVFTFGIHGTLLGGDNPLISSDAPGSLELALDTRFPDEVVVMHLQGAGGDASPAGVDHDYARIESVGALAVDPMMALWEATATSAAPLRLETASRHIPQGLDEIRVTRDGAVDWRYNPYVEDYRADDLIYAEDGSLLSPFDEFNAPYGAAFCGSDAPLIPAGNIGSEVFPYVACMDVELMAGVLAGIFGLDIEGFPLPLPESMAAGTTATRLGPLLTRTPEGEQVEEDLLVGFFPAEPTAMFSEQWRRRVRSRLGDERALLVGYAQDHEGYFLIPEDWLMGGYEPNINLWGPLQAEHVMEGVLDMAEDVLGTTDRREPADPLGWWAPTDYAEVPLPELAPDLSPRAGERLEAPPEYLFVPRGMGVDLEVPERCPRVSCVVQLAWIGGDPGVDLPVVTLERLDGDTWAPVTTPAGRPITDALPDILLATTPDPLYPLEAAQTHTWWAAWQAVGHFEDRAGLPTGTYRLRVEGASYLGGATTWPWPSAPYRLESEPFEVVEAPLALALSGGTLEAWIEAPADGWRLVDLAGDSTGRNPAPGPLHLTWALDDGTLVEEEVEVEVSGGVARASVEVPEGASALEVMDAYGNLGGLAP